MKSRYEQRELCNRRGRAKAFSLVEILVVLAVIAVLAAISVAVFGRVRENGRIAVCQSNQYQIFLAFQSYLQDNDSQFSLYSVWAESLQPYVKTRAVFICPSVSKHNSYHPEVDYDVYPARLNAIQISSNSYKAKGTHEATIPNLTNWILLTDTGSGEPPDVQMFDYPEACSQKLLGHSGLGRNFAQVHNDGGNYLFADGHVKWLNPQAGMEADCAAGPLFLS